MEKMLTNYEINIEAINIEISVAATYLKEKKYQAPELRELRTLVNKSYVQKMLGSFVFIFSCMHNYYFQFIFFYLLP